MNHMVDTLFKRAIWVASIAWMMPSAAQAFSFGVPVVQSHLNEPLRIHLPVRLSSGETMKQFLIDVASPDVYQQWGLQSYMDVSGLHLMVHHEKKEHPYIEIISYQPMNLAWVSFVLVAKKQQHRFYKQVKVILDPVSFSPTSSAYTLHENVVHLPLQKNMKAIQIEGKPSGKPMQIEEQPWARTWRYGPVRSGDSLSTIAYRLRKDRRYSNRSVMLGLYRLNPKAFNKGNINQLKSGVFLNVPHEKELKILLSKPIASHEMTTSPLSQKKIIVKKKSHLSGFVGHVSAHVSSSDLLTSAQNVVGMKGVEKRLNAMYEENMASHLRMDHLNSALGEVDKKIDVMDHQLKQVNQAHLALKNQVDQLAEKNGDSWLWRWGLLILLLLNALGLGALYMRLRNKDRSHSEKTLEPASSSPASALLTVENSVDNHIYDIERAMDHQDYPLVESMLNDLSQGQGNHTRLLALKVRLYHETEQWDERNASVRQTRENLNDMQWRVFCDHLPAALWQALVLADVVSGLSYENDVEEAVKENNIPFESELLHSEAAEENLDAPLENMGFAGIPTVDDITSAKESPSVLNDVLPQEEVLIEDFALESPLQKEKPETLGENEFLSLENMSFEGIPTVDDMTVAEEIPRELDDLSPQAEVLIEDSPLESFLEKEDTEKEDETDYIHVDFSHLSLDGDVDGLHIESDLDSFTQDASLPVKNNGDESTTSIQDEPFMFDFDESLLETDDLVVDEANSVIEQDSFFQSELEKDSDTKEKPV